MTEYKTTDLRREISDRIRSWEWNLEKVQFKKGAHLALDEDQIEEEIKFLKRMRRKVKP